MRQSVPSRTISHSLAASKSMNRNNRKKRPIDDMLEKAQIAKQVDEKAKKVAEPTIKLPLLKGGDSLDNLLNELLSE